MNFITQIERFQTLNKLIRLRRTGTPCELAQRLHISKRQVYNLIEEFKMMGLKVQYSKKEQTYYYAQEEELKINFSVSILTEKELKKIYGTAAKCNEIAHYASTFIAYTGI